MFTAGKVVLVAEKLLIPQALPSLAKKSSNRLFILGKRSFLLASDI
jgi:hypothetical protein